MNEELDRIGPAPDSAPDPAQGSVPETVPEPKMTKANKQRVSAPLTHTLWAKILAFVLLCVFLLLLASGVGEAIFSVLGSGTWENATEFVRDALVRSYGYDVLSTAQRVYASGLLTTVYNLASWWLPMVILGAVGTIACLVFLFMAAGHRKGESSARLNLVDRIPLDLYAAACWAAALGVLFMEASILDSSLDNTWPFIVTRDGVAFAVLAAIALYIIFLVALAPLLSFATRIKVGGGIWWRNTIIYCALRLCWRILKWCWRLVKGFFGWIVFIFRKIPLVPRSALVLFCIVFVNFMLLVWNTNVYDAGARFCFLLLEIVLFVFGCFGAWQMKSLKAAGERMAKGNIDEKIDTNHMYWEFKRHAENLNSIGGGMAAAVEQRMKSERLKTELITNVSHDIKTPLTSIVNYVDLLQRPHTPEQEQEYLEVLDRQSKRLKKLTEDLVEASKASTGNMNVNLERTNTREIIEQSLAEYGRRMEQGNLTVIVNIPEDAPRAMADGRLLWRVLDNLFNNVCKYALAGTRVYIDAAVEGEEAVISVKNISRDPLNLSAEELMERFVRGDASRHTEGSGLGLNIAQSLVNLMHGKFSLSIDGDLFKAEIRLPLN